MNRNSSIFALLLFVGLALSSLEKPANPTPFYHT
jgi:hypothetical protein